MNFIKKFIFLGFAGALAFTITACAPEVGSEKWCNNMKEKPKADWTANEATDFAKHCILK